MIKVFGIHHVAIKAESVELVAGFYRDILGLAEVERHVDPNGRLRSIWLDAAGTILMIECAREPRSAFAPTKESEAFERDPPGLYLLALQIDAADKPQIRDALRNHGVAVVRESAYTLYLLDPEGNRVGLSSYPDR